MAHKRRDQVVERAPAPSTVPGSTPAPRAYSPAEVLSPSARTNIGSGTGNRIVRYTISSGKLSYALGSPRYAFAAWASQSLGMAVMFDPSSTGTCSGNVNQPGACTVQLTGPLRFDAKP